MARHFVRVASALLCAVMGCSTGPSGLVSVEPEAPGSNCPQGGVAVHTGTDDDGDGALGEAEIDATEYVCSVAGTGAPVLIRQDTVPPGATCPAGGVTVLSGVDEDRDGALSDAEIDSGATICSGETGTMGENGVDGTLLRLDDEPPGSNCTAGGTAVHAGADSNDNGMLDDPEIMTTSYVCDTRLTGPHPRIFTAEGTTNECHAASGSTYTTVPDMELDLDLDASYVVLTLFDMTVNPSAANDWVGVRFELDGSAETKWTQARPNVAGEDEHLTLFRIDELTTGSHTVRAQWGDGQGTVCNNADNANPVWLRRMTALAIPSSTGVTFGMARGTIDITRPAASGWEQLQEMRLDVPLTSDAVVLTEFGMNVEGTPASSWVGFRMTVDGVAQPGTHVQPDGVLEDQSVHLFDVRTMTAGDHTLTAEWGEGGGTMSNPIGSFNWYTRRLGYIAIPLSTGVRSSQVSPSTDITRGPGEFSTMSGLGYTLDLAYDQPYISLTQLSFNFYVSGGGGYTAIRTAVDEVAPERVTHSNPNANSEDTHLHDHRALLLTPGPHRFEGQWGGGAGTVRNDASSVMGIWSRHLGTLAIPLRGY